MAMCRESIHWSVGCAAAGMDSNRNQGPFYVSASAEQNTKSLSCANDHPKQGVGVQHPFANEHQEPANSNKHIVHTCWSTLTALWCKNWRMQLGQQEHSYLLEPNTKTFASPYTALLVFSVIIQFAWSQTSTAGVFRNRRSKINGKKAQIPPIWPGCMNYLAGYPGNDDPSWCSQPCHHHLQSH